MNNVISFQKALDDRKSYQENKQKIDALIQERSKAYRDYYETQAQSEFFKEEYPLLSMFFNSVHGSFIDERFSEGLEILGATVEPDTNIILNDKTLVNCFRLYNAYNGKNFPTDSMTVFALGTESGIKTLMGLDVQDALTNADTYSIDDITEVRQLFYEYINEHPDVDTQRDTLGNLSVLSYQAIGNFIENGYCFSRYFYTLIRQEEKFRSIPTSILLEFKKANEENLYIYYDYEAAMRSFEAMIFEIFGED
jgi:hypothetical protein